MTKRTAVGSFDDGGDWIALALMLISLGVLPKSLRPALATVGGALLIRRILRNLGLL
jgi:hypothetical protein